MSTGFLSRLVRRSPSQHVKSCGKPIAQEPKNDRSNTMVARLAKVYEEVVRSCSNDDSVPHAGTYAPVSEGKLTSPGRYSKEGVTYVEVRALSTIPTFVGLDARNYSLQKDDVLFVPCENAQVLLSRGLVAPAEPFVNSAVDRDTLRLRQEEGNSVSSDAD